MRDQNTGAFDQMPAPGASEKSAEKQAAERAPAIQMLRPHSYSVQAKALRPSAPVQLDGAHTGMDTASVHQAAAHGIQGGGGSMPHLAAIQQSFGSHDVSSIQAHTGSAATQANEAMGAEAYATGNHVAFRGAPDLHTAAHEAAHVVQQRSGVSLPGGVGSVGDSYEQHADAVADAVVAGQSAEGLLDNMSGGATAVQQKIVQKEEKTPQQSPEEKKKAALEQTKQAALANAGQASTPAGMKRVLANLPAQTTPVDGGPTSTFAIKQDLANLMVGKLEKAMVEAKAAWGKEDANNAKKGLPATKATKEKAFIKDRLSILKTSAPTVVENHIKEVTLEKPINVENIFWDTCSSNWAMCDPEEEASAELIESIGGVYKAFDAGDLWTKMDKELQQEWATAGGEQAWMNQVKHGQPIPIAPPGKEADPKLLAFVGGSRPAYPGTVSGFISTANALKNDKVVSGSKKEVMRLLALQEERYPSSKMILASMGAAGADQQRGATKNAAKPARLGKPSMFYLLAFKENVYVAENRDSGMTDGGEPELQVTNMPAQAFLLGANMVKA